MIGPIDSQRAQLLIIHQLSMFALEQSTLIFTRHTLKASVIGKFYTISEQT